MLPLIGIAYSFLSGTSAFSDATSGAGMSFLPDQLSNCLSSGSRPPRATMPASRLGIGLGAAGTAPERMAACSFWSCWAIGMPTYSTVMLGLAASKRLISSCHTGVRSGPALVSQNVIVTGAALAVPAFVPPPLVPPPQATASSASRAAASPLSLDSGVCISCPPPLLALSGNPGLILVYSVHEVVRTMIAVLTMAVNGPSVY